MVPACSRTGVLLLDLARGSGGAETRVIDTARGLMSRGVEVRVACLARSPLAQALAAAGVSTVPLARSKWDPRLALSLRRLLAEHNDWVVDAHNAQSQLALHLAAAGGRHSGRLFATVHSEYRESERRPLGLSLHEWVLTRTIRSGWGLVAVTPTVQRNLESLGARPDRLEVVFSGVDSTGRVTSGRAADVREELGLSANDFLVVGVGRLVAVKNFELALRAVHLLHRSLPAARLVLVGEGPERSRLEHLADQLGGPPGLVRFTGHRDDVPDLLAAADAVVITSMTEGLPYVLLEAVAAGTPVVTTSVGAIPELFGDGGVVLLPPGTQGASGGAALLASELLTLARHPGRCTELTACATAIQRQRLTAEAMISATLRCYRALSTADHQAAPTMMVSTP